MAVLNRDNTVYIIIIDSSNALNLEHKVKVLDDIDPDNELEKKLYWCGDTALIITCEKFYILLTLSGECKKQVYRSKGFIVIPELDCVRMFGNDKCEIIKLVPERYTKIFHPTSRAKAADLYNAYLENEEKNPSPENNIIEDKKGLEEGVRDILDAAYFEINTEDQKVLLQAAMFGKAFLNRSNSNFKHNYFTEVCKNLRVINSLKECKIARVVTYMQFLYLDSTPRNFMEILMKYQLFYFANEIALFLDYSKEIISQIYISWACCKIEHNPNDENLAEKIFERLKNDENASYVEVAHKAYLSSSTAEKNRKDLALKIIQYEPSIQKKVVFLLWIDQYEQALSESSKSLDPNLIDLVILKMSKDPDGGQNFWKLVSDNPRTRPRLFKYINDFRYQKVKKGIMINPKNKKNPKELPPPVVENKEDMDELLSKFALPDERAMYFLIRCYNEQFEMFEEYQDPKDKKMRTVRKLDPLQPEDRVFLLDQALKLKAKNNFTIDALNMYKTYLKEDRGSLAEHPEERPVFELLKDKALAGAEGGLVKKYKMSDRLAFIGKLRAMIEQPEKFRHIEGIERFIEDKNKKGDLLSFYEISSMMFENGMVSHAEKYALRIKDWDEQFFMLKYIATTNSINLAVDQAINNKRFDDLMDLANFVQQVEANPGKFPNITLTEDLAVKMAKAMAARR